MKRLGAVLLSAAMVLSLTACGGNTTSAPAASEPAKEPAKEAASEAGNDEAAPAASASAEGTDISGSTLEVAVTYTGDQATTFQGLVKKFEEEYGCTVNIAEYGTDYENTLKTRMAANELPDVFQTHGWSILRYKEYLMDLKDQPWVSDYDDSALGVIQDDDGAIYVLMISELINGTLVNTDVCDAAGVDPYTIHTWDDFTAACEKIKASGTTPICVLSNPGLLDRIAAGADSGEAGTGKETLRKFHQMIYEGYRTIMSGDRNVLFKMKELWTCMIQIFSDNGKYIKRIKKSQRLEEYEAAAAAVFRDLDIMEGAGFRTY